MVNNILIVYRMTYKPDDLNYKMTEFELKIVESKKQLLGEKIEETGSEAISFDTEVFLFYQAQ